MAKKAQALTPYQIGMNSMEIGKCLNIPSDSVRYWIRTAKLRGWEGTEAPVGTDRRRILIAYVEAGRATGRPKRVNSEDE